MINSEKQDEKGVYVIKNLVNGSVYVGKTTRSFAFRWRQHINELNNGVHETLLLQRDWCILGEDNFLFEAIELHYNRKSVLWREKYWIREYEKNVFCYNNISLHWWFFRRQESPAYLHIFKDGEIKAPAENRDMFPMPRYKDVEDYYMEKHYKYLNHKSERTRRWLEHQALRRRGADGSG